MSGFESERTFKTFGHKLLSITNRRPGPNTRTRRIIVRTPAHSSLRFHTFICPWWRDRVLITQYCWEDGTMILNSSTSQLRLLQVHALNDRHGALGKWTAQLGRPVPESLWQLTWINYRSAAENTFLWQLIYRIPATNNGVSHTELIQRRGVLGARQTLPRTPSTVSGLARHHAAVGTGAHLFYRGSHKVNLGPSDSRSDFVQNKCLSLRVFPTTGRLRNGYGKPCGPLCVGLFGKRGITKCSGARHSAPPRQLV